VADVANCGAGVTFIEFNFTPREIGVVVGAEVRGVLRCHWPVQFIVRSFTQAVMQPGRLTRAVAAWAHACRRQPKDDIPQGTRFQGDGCHELTGQAASEVVYCQR